MDYSKLYCTRGAGYRRVKPWSHFNDEIDRADGRPAGNSRRWGDAPEEVQRVAIDMIVAECQEQGLTARETAHVLAIAKIESGFNPDAAAGTTSASGLGQFIESTGERYGLDADNRFAIGPSAYALVAHFIDNRELAKRPLYRKYENKEELIYALHHDGPGLTYGGIKLSREKVMPLIEGIEAALKDEDRP